jgi:hypothetical protein
MAIKEIHGFQFTDFAFSIPTGYGRKRRWWKPRIGIAGTLEERAAKAAVMRELIENCSRAELCGISHSEVRMTTDASTRPEDLKDLEYIIVATVRNENAKLKGKMVIPPLRADFDIKEGSGDMESLRQGIIANCALLDRGDKNTYDTHVRIDTVYLKPYPIKKHDAPLAFAGIDATDQVLELVEQEANTIPAEAANP